MFLVVEIQKTADGHLAVPPVSEYEDWNDAAAKYHAILAAAAKSGLPRHSAVILHEDGHSVANESFAVHEEEVGEPDD